MNITSSFRRLLSVTALVLGVSSSVHASTVVLDFEDLGSGSGAALINYHGVSFDGNFFVYNSSQSPYNPSSGVARAAVNNVGTGDGESIFTFDTANQYFLGAYFSGYSGQGYSPVYFNLYNDGNLVGISGSVGPTSTPTWLSSGYNGVVDYVGIYGTKGYFVFDDLTYSTNARAPGVPDTTSALPLIGAALLGLAAVRRRVRA